MTTVFPGGIDSYTTKVDNVDDVLAEHVNDLQDAVVAIETYVLDGDNSPGQNLLYDTLTHQTSWLTGTTLNDVADADYGPTLWRVLNSGNAPDISGVAGGSTDPYTYSFRCTLDAASIRTGIYQTLEAQDTRPLRGKNVSLSALVWGTDIVEARMAVIVWTGAADNVTADIVSSWGANPTLVANWAYIGTPAAITISTTPTRIAVENLTVPTNAVNIGVFIWTGLQESSGDIWNVANVKLEVGTTATQFIARPILEESLLISRFYQKSYDLNTAPGAVTSAGAVRFQTRTAIASSTSGFLRQSVNFLARMRTAPTWTPYSSSTGAANAVRNNTAGNDRTGVTAGASAENGVVVLSVDNTSANAIALDDDLVFHWTADARL